MRRTWLSVLVVACLMLGGDAVADVATRPSNPAGASRARDLIIGLDLDAARTLLEKADPTDPYVAFERARLKLYEGDCDAAANTLSDPQLAKLDEDEYVQRYDSGLGEIARGCARTTAETSVVDDKVSHVWIRFQDDADRVLAPVLIDTVVKARDSITRDLGVDWPQPTRVVVVRDLVALSAMTGLPYESASTTGTVGVAKWGRVTLLSPRASQHGFAWRDTLAHELTHLAVTHASADRAPLWLQEGLAKREELRWRSPNGFDDRPSPESIVAYGIQKHLDLPLDKLGPSIAMLPSADQAMVAFAEVTSFVRTMVTQAGDDATKKLLAALRAGTPIEQALQSATGSNLQGWDVRWRAQLATQNESPPASLLAAETKDTRTMREHVRLAELLIGRGHGRDAATELDSITGPLLSDPHVRYLKARALDKESMDDARRVLGEPAELYGSYAPWWAIRGRFAASALDPSAANDFVEAIAQDPFDVEAACESLDGVTKAGDPLCDAARASGTPDVGRE
jgi:hypothetical protein